MTGTAICGRIRVEVSAGPTPGGSTAAGARFLTSWREVNAAMALLTRGELRKLIEAHERPCVSLYIPTERAGRRTRENPIRFKNVVNAARDALEQSGLRTAEVEDLLAPARELIQDSDFWRHQADGLAAFAGPGRFFSYRLPLHVEELSVVGEHFHIKPLLPFFSRDGRFYVLALSQNAVRVLEGTHWSVRHLDVRGMPRDLAEALRFDVQERHLQFHTGTGAVRAGGTHAAVFHGQGVGTDDDKVRIREYFRQIDARARRRGKPAADVPKGEQLPPSGGRRHQGKPRPAERAEAAR